MSNVEQAVSEETRELATAGPLMVVTVHLEGIGDAFFRENVFAGTRGESRRLRGFN